MVLSTQLKECGHGNHYGQDVPEAIRYVHVQKPEGDYYHLAFCAEHLANWSGPVCDCAVPGVWPWEQNLETLVSIIEASFHIGRLSITDKSAMCDFPAFEGAIDKVSTAVGFEVKDTDYLLDVAKRMTSGAEMKRMVAKKVTTLKFQAVVDSIDENKRMRIRCDDAFKADWRGHYPVVYANANRNFSVGDIVWVEFSGDAEAAFVYPTNDPQSMVFGVVASPFFTKLHTLPMLKDGVEIVGCETWLGDDALDSTLPSVK